MLLFLITLSHSPVDVFISNNDLGSNKLCMVIGNLVRLNCLARSDLKVLVVGAYLEVEEGSEETRVMEVAED